jgi:serine/threonine protein phosphatase PrpC
LKLYFLFPFDHKGYGAEDGILCGVFDGHGKNGHTVSKLVNNRLPSLILSQKKALAQINAVDDNGNFQNERIEGEFIIPSKSFHIWKEACVDAFKVMDKEIKLQENLDCSCSGAAAVVVIKQVKI